MNFLKVLQSVVGDLEEASVRYALIGGFAMALRGVQRATMDLDFILALEDLERADSILTKHGFERRFQSENVSHYFSEDTDWGRVDLLHAFREHSMGMLDRADTLAAGQGMFVKVARIEDIIGLKIQALYNDPFRADTDWMDIKLLLESAGSERIQLDWELLEEYLEIFRLKDRMSDLHLWYGTDDTGRA